MVINLKKLFLVLSCLVFCGFTQTNDQDVNEAMKEAAEKAKSIKPPIASDEIEKRAAKVAEEFRSSGMLELVREMNSRVRSSLGVDEDETVSDGSVTSVELDFKAILFVSSSIPIPTLRRYAQQLEKVGGVMVFRGAPGGLARLKPMVKLTTDIIKVDKHCNEDSCPVRNIGVIIDPMIFRNNNVERVPALTIVRSDPFKAYCERPDELTHASIGSGVSYGDAHLTGHLEALEVQKIAGATQLLKMFRNEEGG